MPQTTNYGFPLLADTPPEGMTGKDLRKLLLGEDETSLAQMLDAALRNVEMRIPDGQVQADWSQTDDTQPDYIHNKPYVPKQNEYVRVARSGNYNDLGCKPFGEITILPETEINFKGKNGVYGADGDDGKQGELLRAMDMLVPGQQYVVTWDGTEYTLTAGNANDLYEGSGDASYVGNQSLFGLFWGGILGTFPDSGEPFFIATSGGTEISFISDSAGNHTVSIYPVTNPTRKIDRKYLPDGLVTQDEVAKQIAAILPAFSAADNGKVLGIKDGKLAWVKVQAASGGVDASVDGPVLSLGDGATVDGNTLVLDGDASVDGSTLIL